MYFNYSWSDHQEQAQDIAFTLPLLKLNKQTHKKFIPSLAQQYVYIELHKAARKISPKEARVQIQRRGQDIQIDKIMFFLMIRTEVFRNIDIVTPFLVTR